ncbi:MAG: hypothetical protein AAGA90_12780 [Actinomycetota bacterium]
MIAHVRVVPVWLARAGLAGLAAAFVLGIAAGWSVGGGGGALLGAAVVAGSTLLFWAQLRLWAFTDELRPTWVMVVALTLVGVAVVVLMRDADSVLASYAGVGQDSYDIRFLTQTTDEVELVAAIAQLEAFGSRPGEASAEATLWWFVALDSILFIAAYGALVRQIISRQAEIHAGLGADSPIGRLLHIAFVTLMGAVVVDWFENLGLGALYSLVLAEFEVGATATVLMWTISVLWAIKWSLVGVFVLALLFELAVALVRWMSSR